jgi:hypothetical protein
VCVCVCPFLTCQAGRSAARTTVRPNPDRAHAPPAHGGAVACPPYDGPVTAPTHRPAQACLHLAWICRVPPPSHTCGGM